jgi:hypothetical protein
MPHRSANSLPGRSSRSRKWPKGFLLADMNRYPTIGIVEGTGMQRCP